MRVIVIGCGRMGSAAAEDLARKSDIEVFVADKYAERAEETARKIGKTNVKWLQLDASNKQELVNTLKNFDLALGFLPPKFGFRLIEACIEAEKNLVDVSYMPENPLVLHGKAVEAGVTVVPSCGLAPGISNILVGHAVAELDKTRKVHIMIGGLPEAPIPPLGYVITWSPESLIDEYTSKARIIKDGEIVEVEALDGLEEVEFPEIGKLEAFYTDGLRTLLYTVKGVDEMWEKTLRYPGHAEKVRLLRDLGFFSDKEISIEGQQIQPRKLTAKLFERTLIKPNMRDFVVLRVEVAGSKGGKKMRYTYKLVDFYDEENGITAMARTTAYTASIVAALILKGDIRLKGIVPPETLGMKDKIYQRIMAELNSRGIKIIEEICSE
ncbi:MAG: saccharopine dehydrogenase family protein [Candidatus Bathyarchaeia archaeon]